MKKTHSKFLLPGILMVGVVLRAPFAVLPVVLGDIAKGLQVPVNSLGLLTSLPLVMFALCSAFSPRLAQKVGLEKLFTIAMIVLTLGSFIRIFNLPLLYAGTIMLGAAIAVLNVLLPNVIQANQPEKIGFLTTLYITSMGLAISVMSPLAAPIVRLAGWKGLILVLTLICLLACLIWLPNSRHNHKLTSRSREQQMGSLLKNPRVWALIVFGGLQSLLFYTAITWLPTLGQLAGLSDDATGFLASVFSFISLPLAMTIPSLTTRLSAKKRLEILSVFAIVETLFQVHISL